MVIMVEEGDGDAYCGGVQAFFITIIIVTLKIIIASKQAYFDRDNESARSSINELIIISIMGRQVYIMRYIDTLLSHNPVNHVVVKFTDSITD